MKQIENNKKQDLKLPKMNGGLPILAVKKF